MIRPKASTQLDFEGELAVVIGKAGRAIPANDALSYVAGYTCFCDGSVRDFIKISLITGKNFPVDQSARSLDGHGGRNSRSFQTHADDAAEWRADAAFRHGHDDA